MSPIVLFVQSRRLRRRLSSTVEQASPRIFQGLSIMMLYIVIVGEALHGLLYMIPWYRSSSRLGSSIVAFTGCCVISAFLLLSS
jgi:hypothetical protein